MNLLVMVLHRSEEFLKQEKWLNKSAHSIEGRAFITVDIELNKTTDFLRMIRNVATSEGLLTFSIIAEGFYINPFTLQMYTLYCNAFTYSFL